MKTDEQAPVRDTLTHALLVEQAAKWLSRKCAVVITDMTHAGPETADAIGWHGRNSILVECKASVSDFRADAAKSFRINPDSGMGCQRYYCAPRGLLNVNAIPPRWGLLEWDGKCLMELIKSGHHAESAARQEISLLLSALRRVAACAPKGVSVKCYTIETKNRATLGAEAE